MAPGSGGGGGCDERPQTRRRPANHRRLTGRRRAPLGATRQGRWPGLRAGTLVEERFRTARDARTHGTRSRNRGNPERSGRRDGGSRTGPGRDGCVIMINVLLADDHEVVRVGLAAIIDQESDMRVVGQASSGEEAIRLYRILRPDVATIDLK